MPSQNTQINKFLDALGLNSREIEAYLSLLDNGIMTALELSRQSNIPRTTLYRVIESLKSKGVVEEVVEEYVAKVQAAPLSRLEYLVVDQKNKAEALATLFPQVSKIITNTKTVSQPDTKVLMYRGREGIRQMVWNVLDAKTEIVGYTSHQIDDFVGKRFMNRWREEFIDRKKLGRELVTENYYRSIGGKMNDVDWGKWESRFIHEQTLTIDHQYDIYNDIVAIYNWHEGEVFGVEIHNKKVSHLQRQIFEIVWGVAKTTR
ncbi:hypothetical protein COV58_02290 [Candidatus Roizmanbacteria bacterium CG11_big_fil_rev_8_21_14_0_20_36_8]|uniref:Transcription regulator TrmB N-terminal domain-containing protein n=2 Tax=Candidatus Roizmaniibacteriota TaxID=1752723 RepID=A0A2M6IU69_9BACT|nr:MAG: hypothetical protein COV58_02290 [Candidatus Roizmanbacteria bacterium CG11_big_fil_rev_8_21_14_0_20_36_8]PIZ66528.1 MAG: hypothetical protein COY14_00170 [Candidatus Roizmanbacteria bacterium CG_4_10_14_0_2_um_filter_36_9]